MEQVKEGIFSQTYILVDFTYTNSWILTNSNEKERTILWQIWTAVIYYLYGISLDLNYQ